MTPVLCGQPYSTCTCFLAVSEVIGLLMQLRKQVCCLGPNAAPKTRTCLRTSNAAPKTSTCLRTSYAAQNQVHVRGLLIQLRKHGTFTRTTNAAPKSSTCPRASNAVPKTSTCPTASNQLQKQVNVLGLLIKLRK